MRKLIWLSTAAIILISTGVASQDRTNVREIPLPPLKPVTLKQPKTKASVAPAPSATTEEPQSQASATAVVPPQPPQTVIVPAPQVTITGPSQEGWLGWALLGLGISFVIVYGVQTALNRHGIQLTMDPKALFNDPEFRHLLTQAIHTEGGETAALEARSTEIEQAIRRALSGPSINKRGERS